MSDASSHDSAPFDPDDLTDQQRDILAEIENEPQATQQDLADAFDVSQATISTHLNAIDGFDWGQRQAFVSRLPADALPDRDTDATDDTATETESDTDQPGDGNETTATSSTGTTNAVGQTTGEHQPAAPESTTESTDEAGSDPSNPTAEIIDVADRVADLEHQLDDKLQALQQRLDEQTGATEELDDRLTDLERGVDELHSRLDDHPQTAGPLDDSELAAKVIHACMEADTIDETEEHRIIERLTTTPPSSN